MKALKEFWDFNYPIIVLVGIFAFVAGGCIYETYEAARRVCTTSHVEHFDEQVCTSGNGHYCEIYRHQVGDRQVCDHWEQH